MRSDPKIVFLIHQKKRNLKQNSMQKKTFLAMLSIAAAVPAMAQWGQRTPTPNDTLQSVRISKNHDVTLSIYAPNAREVKVGGDVNYIEKNLTPVKQENGVWTVTAHNAGEGIYRYHFVVDGMNVYDPKAADAHETTAYLTVIRETSEFFRQKDEVPRGTIAQRFYHSKTLNQMRRMHIWLPAGYEKTCAKLPVFYLIHGGGEHDMTWSTQGAAGTILDNLYAEGKIPAMLVVMPNGSIQTNSMDGEVPLFTQDMVESIMPFIESNYNVYTDSEHTALAGLSMGGLETMDLIMKYPNKFGYVNVMSSGWWKDEKRYAENDAILKSVAPTLQKTIKYLIFTQGGPEDIAYENGKETMKVFEKYGIKHDYSERPGGHSWSVWRYDLLHFAQKLFK